MARTKKDRVTPHLVRAKAALRRERDPYLDRLLDQAISHRAATIASGQPRAAALAMDKRVLKALEHIHANLGDQRLSLSTMSSAAAASMFHLARMFKKAVGCPPMAYAMQKRLELAKEMLAHRPGVTIVNVALKSGFSCQSSLSVAFKKEYGVSPAAFRKAAALAQRTARR